MAFAACAMVFGTRVDQFEVEAGFDGARQGGGETGPASAAVIFHVGGEQGQGTAGTDIGALALFVIERTGVGPFGAVLAQDLELCRRQDSLPLGLTLDDFLECRLALLFTEQDTGRKQGSRGNTRELDDEVASVHILDLLPCSSTSACARLILHKRFYLKRIDVDRLFGGLVPGWIGV